MTANFTLDILLTSNFTLDILLTANFALNNTVKPVLRATFANAADFLKTFLNVVSNPINYDDPVPEFVEKQTLEQVKTSKVKQKTFK